jgi:DNA polymerase-1
MQIRGIHIDLEAVKTHQKDAEKRLEKFRTIWVKMTGVTEIGEDGQTDEVKAWFWRTKGLPVVSFDRETKAPKLDNDALLHYLNEIEDEVVNDAAAALIGYRKAAKALSMLRAYNVPIVHPEWNVTGTKGARWTSKNPNLMQLPTHDVKYPFPHGIETVAVSFKNIIIPRPGCVFVGADYSALEVYQQTYLAGAQRMLGWIRNGEDLHMNNARIFFGDALPPDATKKTHKLHREVGKLGFGFVYSVSDHVGTTLKQMKGKMPGLTEQFVKEARLRYFEAHPEFVQWQKATIKQIDKYGYIEVGLMKRRLYLEASTRGYNQAMNAQCQNPSGDMLNHCVIASDGALEPLGGDLALTWYDNLTAQVPNDPAVIRDAGALIKGLMQGPFPINGFNALFVAEPTVGPNLQDDVPL